MRPERETLDNLVRDSREMLEPGMMGSRVDWEKVEDKLFARIEQAKATNGNASLGTLLSLEQGRDRGRSWALAAAALAVAAAMPLFFGRPSSGVAVAPMETMTAAESRAERSAGALAWKEGSGDVRIGTPHLSASTSVMSAGAALERDDAVETHGVRAVFERRGPASATSASTDGALAVTWALEDASRFLVKGTHGALILGLERGAVEAQVTPVQNGEAFAVDVDGARVAVHGTHLRVARDGVHVVVDLTEGVVSIGTPPRSGSTYGKLVNAPAHIEFDANDPHGTLKVTHEANRVRAAIALRPPQEALATVTPRAQIAPERHPAPAQVGAGTPVHAPIAIAPKPERERERELDAQPVPAPTPAPQQAEGADAHPEQTIANAVRDCMRASASTHADDIVVTVSSTLELRVGADGNVELAKFAPPLEPEVQTCASSVIYKTRFAKGGVVSIPLDLRR